MMFQRAAAGIALSMVLAGAAAAGTVAISDTQIFYRGVANYQIDPDLGLGAAVGVTLLGDYDLFLDGFFDPGTAFDNPTDVVLGLLPVGGPGAALTARGLDDLDVEDDLLAFLFDDLEGDLAGQFRDGLLLAVFRATDQDGVATFELRGLTDPQVIPLPATALLLGGAVAALGVLRRRRS